MLFIGCETTCQWFGIKTNNDVGERSHVQSLWLHLGKICSSIGLQECHQYNEEVFKKMIIELVNTIMNINGIAVIAL